MASRSQTQVSFTFKKCNGDDIIKWCEDNNQVAWLKAAAADNQNFLKLKRAFFEKFLPEIIPQPKPKTKPFRQRIENL